LTNSSGWTTGTAITAALASYSWLQYSFWPYLWRSRVDPEAQKGEDTGRSV